MPAAQATTPAKMITLPVPQDDSEYHGQHQIADQQRLDQGQRAETQGNYLQHRSDRVEGNRRQPQRPRQQIEQQARREDAAPWHLLGTPLLDHR